MTKITFWFIAILISGVAYSQNTIKLVPERVFDGVTMHQGWIVVVDGSIIVYVGEPDGWKEKTYEEHFPNATLIPGMIEGHAHMFLYPYNETQWNDQVLKESESYRMAKAVVHAEKTLMAGFTTVRDLGTEGAGYADAGLKKAINDGTIPGPRLIISSKAVVSTGSYGPKGFADHFDVPLGAEETDGYDGIIRVVRDQIGHGADFIKVYADYRWGPNGEAQPTFSIDELKLMVSTAKSSGRYVVAHASSEEGMRRAVLAGVETIEHGDGGTDEIWQLMKEHNVAFCPTIAAGDAILQYNGWMKGEEPEPERIKSKRESFKAALNAGVKIIAGGDVGVFPHGDNVRELELMSNYGMSNLDVLKSVTSVNSKVFHLENQYGFIRKGYKADLVIVSGDPSQDISDLRNIEYVMKDGKVYVTNIK